MRYMGKELNCGVCKESWMVTGNLPKYSICHGCGVHIKIDTNETVLINEREER